MVTKYVNVAEAAEEYMEEEVEVEMSKEYEAVNMYRTT